MSGPTFLDPDQVAPGAEVIGRGTSYVHMDALARRYWYAAIVFDLPVRDCPEHGFYCRSQDCATRVVRPWSQCTERLRKSIMWHLALHVANDHWGEP